MAAAAGATYLGVVFAGGSRMVTEAVAAAIVAAAGDARVLGVFDRQPIDVVLAVAMRTGLHGIQLHGGYSAADAARVRRTGLLAWRVARLAGADSIDALPAVADEADAVLIEPLVEGAGGGTGRVLDAGLAQAARARLAGTRLVLAGGLRAETVASAVALVGPDVVDVSSGVEIGPGLKDPGRIARFLEALA